MGSASSKSTAEHDPLKYNVSENVLQMLGKFDTVILVDDSSSMRGQRWRKVSYFKAACYKINIFYTLLYVPAQTGKALVQLAKVAAEYDQDGLEIFFLNSKSYLSENNDASQIEQLFRTIRPNGPTPLRGRLGNLLENYGKKFEADPRTCKPVNFIVITDGAPTDGNATEEAVIKMARSLDAHNARVAQVGIQFVQIGNDPAATAYLKHLDDELQAKSIRVCLQKVICYIFEFSAL